LQKLLLLEMELDCYVSEMFTYLASYFFWPNDKVIAIHPKFRKVFIFQGADL
jgi:hypothetical protein